MTFLTATDMRSKKEIEKLYNECLAKNIDAGFDGIATMSFYIAMFSRMFGFNPNVISTSSLDTYLNKKIAASDENEEDEEKPKDDFVYSNSTNTQLTMINMHDAYADVAYIFRDDDNPVIVMDERIIFYYPAYNDIFFLQKDEFLSEEFISKIALYKSDEDKYASYIIAKNGGFDVTPMKVKKQTIDLGLNYNDDLPHEKIVDFLTSDESGLMLLHGECGTGKTTYIRHLMYELFDTNFLILDSSVLAYINDGSFLQLLLNNRNSVVILEDCESLLAERAAGNALLATLLNLSDGIIGDSLQFKFICTFNASISKLDSAILRKGRLKLKYEFKKLENDKVKTLMRVIGKNIPAGANLSDMTLADIYNYGDDNGVKKENKIGFKK